MGSSMGCSLCICSTMVSYRGTSALVPAAHFPLVLLSGWCLVGLFLTLFHGCQAAFSFFFFFSSTVTLRSWLCGPAMPSGGATGAGWSQVGQPRPHLLEQPHSTWAPAPTHWNFKCFGHALFLLSNYSSGIQWLIRKLQSYLKLISKIQDKLSLNRC